MLAAEILQEKRLRGVTFSGRAFLAGANWLLATSSRHKIHLVVYSSYTFEELKRGPDRYTAAFLSACDLLIDGPFKQEEKIWLIVSRISQSADY